MVTILAIKPAVPFLSTRIEM